MNDEIEGSDEQPEEDAPFEVPEMEDEDGDGLVPRSKNGKLDLLAYIRTTWPIILAVIGFVWWMSGRLETPSQKSERLRLILQPTMQTVERQIADTARLRGVVEAHMDLGGHAVMDQRMKRVESDITSIQLDIKEIKALLRNPP
jgi:hypothetical protein